MAQKISVESIDDLDGTKTANTTINYTFESNSYEIDLCTENAEKFRAEMKVWIDHSRQTFAPRGRKRLSSSREDLAAIRVWAASQGMTVSPRGRIKSDIVTAYHNRNVSALKPVVESTTRKRASARRVAAAVQEMPAPELSAAE